MTEKRFVEILVEEGYPKEIVQNIWDNKPPDIPSSSLSEDSIREFIAFYKAVGRKYEEPK